VADELPPVVIPMVLDLVWAADGSRHPGAELNACRRRLLAVLADRAEKKRLGR